jgi:hypothetical protein
MRYLLMFWIKLGLLIGVAMVDALPALAELRSRSYVITITQEEEIPTVKLQAESIVQTDLSQGFLDPRVMEMRVGVSGEWAGQILPLVQRRMTREDWLKNPRGVLLNGPFWNGQRLLNGRSKLGSVGNRLPIVSPPVPNPPSEREDNFYPNR